MSKVLLVEDDEVLARMYQTKFQHDGYQTVIAYSGQEGIDFAAKEKPDVILLDIMMPKKNGLEVLEQIKKDPAVADIPVVMLTVLGDEGIRNNAFNLGAKYYLVKSDVVPLEVVKLIRQELGII